MEPISSTLRHEGFIAKVFKRAGMQTLEARWFANQSLFNGADDAPVNVDAKESVIATLKVGQQTCLAFEETADLLDRARNATTKRELRDVVEAADDLLEQA